MNNKYTILKNKIVNEDTVLAVNSVNDTITILADLPCNTVITLNILGTLTIVPFVSISDNGNIFKATIVISDKMLNSLINATETNATILANNNVVTNNIKCFINTNNLVREDKNKQLNLIRNTYKLINEINKKLMSDPNNPAVHSYCNVAKGMTPITIDNKGNYVWDYPYRDVQDIIKASVEVIKELSKHHKELVERVNKLELELKEFKYDDRLL